MPSGTPPRPPPATSALTRRTGAAPGATGLATPGPPLAAAAAPGEIGLDVSIESGSVRVEVANPGPAFVVRERDNDTSRPGGWGLYLVDRIADRWGVARNSMTRVWFEIDGIVA